MPMEHREIEEAILSGDYEKARVAAGEHVKNSNNLLSMKEKRFFKTRRINKAGDKDEIY